MSVGRKITKRLGLLSALAVTMMLLPTASAGAALGPVWEVNAHHGPSAFQPGGTGEYRFWADNIGDAASSGPFTIEVKLPPGVTTRMRMSPFFPQSAVSQFYWQCPQEAGLTEFTCTSGGVVRPGGFGARQLTVFVDIASGVDGVLAAEATLSGGGADPVTTVEPAPVGPDPDAFGIEAGSWLADAFDATNLPERRAGSHPVRGVGAFDFITQNTTVPLFSEGVSPLVTAVLPVGTVRDVKVALPPGFVGNPQALARCSFFKLVNPTGSAGESFCPPESQVGTVQISTVTPSGGPGWPVGDFAVPLYNMAPPQGSLAAFGFHVLGRRTTILASLDPRDYSVVTTVSAINESVPVHYQRLSLWGVPGDPVHASERYNPETGGFDAPFAGPVKPFLSMPTQCGVARTTELTSASWQDPSNLLAPLHSEPVEVNGCNQLDFDPTVTSRPTTNVADAPAGFEFDLHLAQSEDPGGRATAHLKDAVVTLPEGMTVNPPSADGLEACSLEQIGISAVGVPNGDAVTCPEPSKLGTVEAISPALEDPVQGSVYLAEQNRNPFNSLLAMYIVLEDKERGLLVKLLGRVDPDPSTGRLTATFRDNPQLPVEDLHMKLKEGPRAALKTPATCGTHSIDSTFTPWSSPEGADVKRASSFELTQGPSGACPGAGAQAANAPGFRAGTLAPVAKAFTPFALKLSRADGTQQLKSIDTTLPKGLLGKLAGTTYCSDGTLAAAATRNGRDEKAVPSCPASSHVGSVDVGAGAGSTPLYVSGEAYLAGPYKGAPLSLAIVTPAVAGPFDLGSVVVRTALYVNPETAQIHAVSDPIPTILQGIPLNLRSIALKMDRPQFTLNPTSCDPMTVDASATSVFGQTAALSNPFQVGECSKLGFKPKLAIRLEGGSKRSQHPALTATVTARRDDANIGRTSVALPHSEFLAQDHINTICTRVQYAADACPAGSIYGSARAWSPLLDKPLEGPVYLRSSSHQLPDMVIALNGQIDVDLVGRIDSVNGGIRTTFDSVPDAPVSRFVLSMKGGKKGLLENSRNICSSVNRATVQMDAQSGKTHDSNPVLKGSCTKKNRHGKHGKG